MSEPLDELLMAWGKTVPGGGWHPLAHHAIDTAAVMSLLWDRMLSPRLRKLVADGLGVYAIGDARRWLQLCAWLHDVGKLTCRFQALDTAQARRLAACGWALTAGVPAKHGAVTARTIEEALRELGPSHDLRALGTAVGGHHGAFPRSLDPLDGLAELRARFVELARGRTGPHRQLDGLVNPALATIAGMITLADWVASDSRWFPASAATLDHPLAAMEDLDAYEEQATTQAERAWSELRWATPPARGSDDRLRKLFPFIAKPTSMQAAAAAASAQLGTPALCVIEDRTGSGKTEAAVLLADASIGAGQTRGLFIGLPTRATADQTYRRVAGAFNCAAERGDQVRVELVHGLASLTPAYRQFAAQPDLCDVARDEEGGPAPECVIAGGWFSQRKRGLLAPTAVGTVDQALLAVLPSRHFALRLLSLAGKVVVLDEVHAYDVYMETIVQRLLEWLASLGCPVVLLSATLPARARDELLAAYSRGLGTSPVSNGEVRGYPRITVVSRRERRTRPVRSHTRRVTRVELSCQGRLALSRRAIALASAGLEVAVIANTVARARAWLTTMERLAPAGLPVELLHARFRLVDRAAIETRVLERYGPRGERPGGSVVVATQVLEQSLDLDFDLVLSELAPVDLLMQRAGRSHRHPRRRSTRAGKGPWLWVAVPPRDDDGLPIIARDSVYDEHILLRSYVVLRDHLSGSGGLVVEEGSRSDLDGLVGRVYCEEEEPAIASERWRATSEAMRARQEEQCALAMSRLIAPPRSPHLITDAIGGLFDEDDPAAPLPPRTRLGPDPIKTLLLERDECRELALSRPGDPTVPYPPELIAWLTMRTASLPRGPWRGHDLHPADDRLARSAPALAWAHRIELDGAGCGELLGVPLRNDRRLGVLVGSEASTG